MEVQNWDGLVKLWSGDGVVIDHKARQQLNNVAQLPFIYKWVAAMPDAHWGMGATVGSVIATKGAIIPAAVGVDLGCGMAAVRYNLTPEDLPDSLDEVLHSIERTIPHGGLGIKGGWKEIPDVAAVEWENIERRWKRIVEKHPKVAKGCTVEQLGTLGGGNHFIELCIGSDGSVYLMLHSGSRGLGNRVGRYFIDKAKEEMQRMFIHLPDKDLAYISEGSTLFNDYVEAVEFAQDFAFINRGVMMQLIFANLKHYFPNLEVLEGGASCHHNYIARENHYGSNVWVTRKGAVRARMGDLGIIPGSMGARSYIVEGLGNPESFHSCSHGAGRVMSRGEAQRTLTVEDHIRATAGVACRKDESILDESPAAYKDIDAVMAAQSDLVRPVVELKQVLCVKG